jgi:hypothetical protein
VDWGAVVLVVVILTVAVVGIVAITRIGINLGRRPRKPTRIRRAEGEYQPPEPPEGRYWG